MQMMLDREKGTEDTGSCSSGSRSGRRSRDSLVPGFSRVSECLSIREIEQVCHMVLDKMREMRRDNIVIKRWGREGQVNAGQVEKFLRG